jgi:DNA-binding SARP family transcriptional activator/tetratricopeptide (TPR) repeat protein
MAEPVVAVPECAVRFGVLGPLEVVDSAGAARLVPAAKQRVVLAALLLGTDSIVTAASLIEAVWDASPPLNAPAVMRTYVTRLRHVLGPAGARIAGRPAGWAVELHCPEELDITEVDGLWRAARAAAEAGEWRQVSSLLTRALSLWRGEPLVDVPSAALARREAGRLTELRIQLTEARIDADLRVGRHGELVAELRRLAAEHPLREHLRVQLMLACYRCGHQAAALQVYRDARKMLADELGVEPGRELHEMHQRILTADPDLTPGAVFGGVFGTGQDRVLRARTERIIAADSAETAPGSVPFLPVFQLPAVPADFTGRAAESAFLTGAITPEHGGPGVPLVVVSGLPGAGKTSLALYAAHTVRAQFPDGQLWVQLAGTSARPRDAGEVLEEFLRALGVDGRAVPRDLPGRSAWFRSRLAGRRILVVADDAASAAQVRPLVPGTAGCALIVTSRSHLEDLDGAQLMSLGVMTEEDAVRLLARIVGEDRVAADGAGAGSLVRACRALPLALRISGARLAARPMWPLTVLARKIDGGHARLRELESGEVSVRATIDSSYQTLSDRARRALCLLAELGPTDFAGWVTGPLLGEPDAADVIDELVGRSLLTPLGADATGEPRYRLHDLLRDFAAERLMDESVDTQAAHERLLTGWIQLARLGDSRLPPEPFFPPPAYLPEEHLLPEDTAARLTAEPGAWFAAERLNLLAAAERACAAGRPDLTARLGSFMSAFHHLQDRRDDAERLWRMIVDSTDQSAGHRTETLYARIRVAASTMDRGRATEAAPILDQCVKTAEQAQAAEVLAFALYWRGACAWDLDDVVQAHQYFGDGQRAARQAGSPLGELLNTRFLGTTLARLGQPDQAVTACEWALAIAVSLKVPSYELAASHNLAFTCTLTGRYDQAVRVCKQRIELARQIGSARCEAHAHAVLADAYYGMGNYAQAIQSSLRALPVFRDTGGERFYAAGLLRLGLAYEAAGSPAAADCLQECLQIFGQLRLPAKVAQARQALDRCRAIAENGQRALVGSAASVIPPRWDRAE